MKKVNTTYYYRLMIIWSGLMLVVAVLTLEKVDGSTPFAPSWVRHDYGAYLKQWNVVLAGGAPWAETGRAPAGANAYGPLHNLLAIFLAAGDIGPKIVISGTLLGVNMLLFAQLLKLGSPSALRLYVMSVPANFLVIVIAFFYGLNDVLVATFVIAAALARFSNRNISSGALLGLAILLKYYPAILVPFFMLDNRSINWRVGLSATATFGLGMIIAVIIWGDGPFAALRFAADRDPTLLSVLAPLAAHPTLIGGASNVDLVIRMNTYMVLGVWIVVWMVAWSLRVNWLAASVLGLLAVLLTYKVGHQQFFVPWVFLVAALPLAKSPKMDQLAWTCLPFVIFLSVYQFGFTFATDRYRTVLNVVRVDGGLVSFLLGFATIGMGFMVLGGLKKPRARRAPRSTRP